MIACPVKCGVKLVSKLAHRKSHGIPLNSMELLVSSKFAHFKFNGIHGIAHAMEFVAPQVPLNSMELTEIGTLQVPWNLVNSFYFNLMESFATSILWVLNLDWIPWNFEFPNFDDNYIQFSGWINLCGLINILYLFVSILHAIWEKNAWPDI